MSHLLKLPYGLRKEGKSRKLIHISEILPEESGLKCNCVCPKCEERLQAKLPNTKEDFTPRFAHHNSDTCDYATETAIHMKAKEIIEKEKHMVIPRVEAHYHSQKKEVSKQRRVIFDTVKLEHRVSDIIPDILAYSKNHLLMIEIKVTHGIDDNKMKKIKECGISTIEIDLSDIDTNFDPEFLYNEIILGIDRKKWIYNSEQRKAEEVLEAVHLKKLSEYNEYKKKKYEKEKKRKMEGITLLINSKYQEQLKQKWSNTINHDPMWKNVSSWLNISFRNMPEYINIEIPGEVVFGCDRRIWQGYIFYSYIHNKLKYLGDKANPISANIVYTKVCEHFKDRILKDLVNLDNLDGFDDVPDLKRVIYNYLKELEKLGFLSENIIDNTYNSRFKLLKPDRVYEMRIVLNSIPEIKIINELTDEGKWEECKNLIQELLSTYSQVNLIEYCEALEYLYDQVCIKSKDLFNNNVQHK